MESETFVTNETIFDQNSTKDIYIYLLVKGNGILI